IFPRITVFVSREPLIHGDEPDNARRVTVRQQIVTTPGMIRPALLDHPLFDIGTCSFWRAPVRVLPVLAASLYGVANAVDYLLVNLSCFHASPPFLPAETAPGGRGSLPRCPLPHIHTQR